ILRERLAERPLLFQRLRERADRREIVRRVLDHLLELTLRLVELVQFEQGAAERHAGGVICGVNVEAGPAGVDRFLELSRAAVLFGELRKRNRRRVLLDPSSETFKT